MLTEEYFDYAINRGYIDSHTKLLLEEYNERLSQNNVPIIYNLRHLRKILKIRKCEQEEFFGKDKQTLYKVFKILKKNGNYREIEAPNEKLKVIQKWIKDNILESFQVSKYARGFVKGKSIYDNAISHVGKELVVNLDLKDFFPTISYEDVFKIFKYIGYTNEVSHLLTKLCINSKNRLPQGSPASPNLSNLVCLRLDKRLSKLAECNHFDYTRYADDITISGDESVKYFLPTIYKIIKEEGFVLNETKTRLQFNFKRQEVTGLVVNKKVAVSKKLRKELENAIYFCKKYGVVDHMEKIGCNRSFYKEHLYGIAYFIKMISKEDGERYLQELDEIIWLY